MKNLSQLLMALLLAFAMPVWAAPAYQESKKSYEGMTAQEIRDEVERLELELINQARRLAGLPLYNDQAANSLQNEAPAAPEKADQTAKQETINTDELKSAPRQKPARKLRQIRKQALVKASTMSEEEARRISMHTLIKDEFAKMEKEKQRSEKQAIPVVKLNPAPKTAEPKISTADDGMREIELELPLNTGHGKQRKKERIKIKARPDVMALHSQIQGLNQMLIDDVVRMTGAPLQKKKQKVRRK